MAAMLVFSPQVTFAAIQLDGVLYFGSNGNLHDALTGNQYAIEKGAIEVAFAARSGLILAH